jgi:hypothetical protein
MKSISLSLSIIMISMLKNVTSSILRTQFSWIESYLISLHSLMRCWIKTEKNSEDVQAITKQLIRCKEQWHSKSSAHHDFLWMQKYDDNFNISSVDEKTLDQLQAIIIIWRYTSKKWQSRMSRVSWLFVDHTQVNTQWSAELHKWHAYLQDCVTSEFQLTHASWVLFASIMHQWC